MVGFFVFFWKGGFASGLGFWGGRLLATLGGEPLSRSMSPGDQGTLNPKPQALNPKPEALNP